MPNITAQDDKFYYAGDKKIAKNGLSANKKKEFDAQLNQSAYDPRFDAPGNQFETITSPSQLNLTPVGQPAMSMAPQNSLYGVPVNNPAVPLSGATPVNNAAPAMPPLQAQAPVPMVGRQTVQTETIKGTAPSPELVKATAKAYETQIEAQGKIAAAQAKATEEAAKANQALEFELAQQDYARQQIQERKQIAADEAMAKYQSTLQELDDAKVDPDKFYGGSIGKRLLAAIAIGVGEYARIMSGSGQNTALAIINKAIDDDIASQKANITQLGNKATLQRQAMADLRAKYDDEISGNLAQRAAMLEMAQRKIATVTAKATSEQQIAQGQALMGQIDAQKNQVLIELQQRSADKTAVKTIAEYAPATSGMDGKELNAAISNLRKERNSHKVTVATNARKEALSAMESAYENANAAGDIALITSYMKMLDPGSTVRESEFATAQFAASVPDNIRNMYNKVLSGERLTEKQRQQFMGVAKTTFSKQLKEQSRVDSVFKKDAERQGLPLDLIFEQDDYSMKPANELSATFTPSQRGK